MTLLFDERSEVKDSHDRYANMVVSYLLQRIEAYTGVAILATNLRQNRDEAFVRRLQYIVEFRRTSSAIEGSEFVRYTCQRSATGADNGLRV